MSYTLGFTRTIVLQIDPNTEEDLNIPPAHIWKIESAGIAGTNAALYLQSVNGNQTDKIAILFTTIGRNDFAAHLPFWLDETFSGNVRNENEGGFKGVVSISEYHLDIII